MTSISTSYDPTQMTSSEEMLKYQQLRDAEALLEQLKKKRSSAEAFVHQQIELTKDLVVGQGPSFVMNPHDETISSLRKDIAKVVREYKEKEENVFANINDIKDKINQENYHELEWNRKLSIETERLSKLESEREQLKSKKKQHEIQLKDLENQMNNLYSSSGSETDRLKSKTNDLGKQIDRVNSQIEVIKKSIESENNDINFVNANIKEEEKKLNECEDQKKTLMDQLSKIDSLKFQIDGSLSFRKSRLEKYQKEEAQAKIDLEAYQNALSNNVVKTNEIRAKEGKIQLQIEQKERSIHSLGARKTAIQEEMDRLLKELNKVDADIGSEAKEKAKLETELKEIPKEYNALVSEAEMINNNLKKINDCIDSSKSCINNELGIVRDLEKKLWDVENEKKEAQGILGKLDFLIRQSINVVQQQGSSKDKLDRDLLFKGDELKNLENEKHRSSQILFSTEQELIKLKGQFESETSRYRNFDEQKKSIQTSINNCENELARLVVAFRDAEDSIVTLNMEMKTAQPRLRNFQTQISAYERQIESLKNEEKNRLNDIENNIKKSEFDKENWLSGAKTDYESALQNQLKNETKAIMDFEYYNNLVKEQEAIVDRIKGFEKSMAEKRQRSTVTTIESNARDVLLKGHRSSESDQNVIGQVLDLYERRQIH